MLHFDQPMAELDLRERKLRATLAYLGAPRLLDPHETMLAGRASEGIESEGIRELRLTTDLADAPDCSADLSLRFPRAVTSVRLTDGVDAVVLFVDATTLTDPWTAAARLAIESESARRRRRLPVFVRQEQGAFADAEEILARLGLPHAKHAEGDDPLSVLGFVAARLPQAITAVDDGWEVEALLDVVTSAVAASAAKAFAEREDRVTKLVVELAALGAAVRETARAIEVGERAAQARQETLRALVAKSTDELRPLLGAARATSQALQRIEAAIGKADARLDALGGLCATSAQTGATVPTQVAQVEHTLRAHGEHLSGLTTRLGDLTREIGRAEATGQAAGARTDRDLRALLEEVRRVAEAQATHASSQEAAMEALLDDLQKRRKGWFG